MQIVEHEDRGDVVKVHELQEKAEKTLKHVSISRNIPALAADKVPSVDFSDPYQKFRYEPLHNMHLGVTKTIILLMNERTGKLFARPNRIFRRCNVMLTEIDRFFKCYDLDVDFSRSGKEPSLNGLFKAYRVKVLMDARNYGQIENILSFIGAVVDRVLDQVDAAPLKSLFAPYADFVRFHYRRGTAQCCTSGYFLQLHTRIEKFKTEAFVLFPDVHDLCTVKFHLLDHVE